MRLEYWWTISRKLVSEILKKFLPVEIIRGIEEFLPKPNQLRLYYVYQSHLTNISKCLDSWLSLREQKCNFIKVWVHSNSHLKGFLKCGFTPYENKYTSYDIDSLGYGDFQDDPCQIGSMDLQLTYKKRKIDWGFIELRFWLVK